MIGLAFAPLRNAVVLLLSGILLPMTFAPGWLPTLSDINPLEHIVDGARSSFRGDFGTSSAWWAVGPTVAPAVVAWWSGVRRVRHESG